MRKIMFSDRYNLNQAVLDGRKTMTRRLVGNRMTEADIVAYLRGYPEVAFERAPYKIGEVVAVAQSYHDIGMPPTECIDGLYRRWCDEPGWTNKMFVKAELMQSRIKFTDMRIERMQDISDEDILKEGIIKNESGFPDVYYFFDNKQSLWNGFPSAREAFAVLIDKVSGKGTWESNPWVYAYDLERVKGGNK